MSPPFIGVAVKVTLSPEHIVVDVAPILTLADKLGFTVITISFEFAGEPVKQGEALDVITTATSLAEQKRVYILSHTSTDDFGKVKIKTIGKLLDEKIVLEGLVSIVLRTSVTNGNYMFSTKNNGYDTVKSPLGLFDADLIENDLLAVDQAIKSYYF